MILYNCANIDELKKAIEDRMCGVPVIIHYDGVEYDLTEEGADITPLLNLINH